VKYGSALSLLLLLEKNDVRDDDDDNNDDDDDPLLYTMSEMNFEVLCWCAYSASFVPVPNDRCAKSNDKAPKQSNAAGTRDWNKHDGFKNPVAPLL